MSSVLQADEEDAQSSPREDFANRFAEVLKDRDETIHPITQRNPEKVDLPSCVHPRVSAFFLHSEWIRNHAAILVQRQAYTGIPLPLSMDSGKALSFS